MKKAFPLLALLLVLAAVVAFTARRTGGVVAGVSVSRAAELAPAETVLYLEIPDVPRTSARWERSALAAISREPGWQNEGWQSFLTKWSADRSKNVEDALLMAVLGELGKVEPAGLFIAATNLDDGPWPKVVGGIAYRAKKSEVEASIRALKERLFKSWPAAKSELSNQHGMEIESITGPSPPKAPTSLPRSIGLPVARFSYRRVRKVSTEPPSVHLAYRDDWLFFATDRAQLAATLDRYVRAPGTAQGLAADPAFAEGRSHDLPEADVLVWARWEPVARQFAEEWLTDAIPSLADKGNALQSVRVSARVEGTPTSRMYFQAMRPPPPLPLGKRPSQAELGFTTTTAPSLVALHFDALRGDEEWLKEKYWQGPPSLDALLTKHRLTLEDFWAAFGPAVTRFDYETWPYDAIALDVRDPRKARKFAELFAGGKTQVSMTDEGEMTEWAWDSTKGLTLPSPMVLTKTHLVFGLSLKTLQKGEWRGGSEVPTLEANPAYAAALRGINDQNAAFFYFDPQRLFQGHAFRIPMDLARFVGGPAGLFPAATRDAIRKHLRPGVVVVRTEGQGWLVESSLGLVETHMVNEGLGRKR